MGFLAQYLPLIRIGSSARAVNLEKVSTLLDIIILRDIFIVAFTDGVICHYNLCTLEQISEYKHSTGIRKVWSHPLGLRLLFVDQSDSCNMLDVIRAYVIPIPNISQAAFAVWEDDLNRREYFFICEKKSLSVFLFCSTSSINQDKILEIGRYDLSLDGHPLLIYKRNVILLVCYETYSLFHQIRTVETVYLFNRYRVPMSRISFGI